MAASYKPHGKDSSSPLCRVIANLSVLSPVSLVPSLTMSTSLVWALYMLLVDSKPAQAVQQPPQPNQQCHSAQRNEEREDDQDGHCNWPVVEVVANKNNPTLTSATLDKDLGKCLTYARPVKLASKVSCTE